MWFLSLLGGLLLWCLLVFLGALSIDLAIYNFKREKYFLFGLECFTALIFACDLIKIIFKI